MSTIQVRDKRFKLFIEEDKILTEIKRLAAQISTEYRDRNPLFLAVLNGSFMFASDLLKSIDFECEISFIKLASYHGTSSTGKVMELIGMDEDIEGRDVIIVEDIVDTGNTLVKLKKQLGVKNPKSIEVATMLLKPEALRHDLSIKYVGLEIPIKFIVGYGLDYDGLGRNYRDIYQLSD